ncbi:helix-turn-helix domain-containing protein [[Phormidium] sp. ETS-05]|uniref:helix-turn-helix domain-containing protein n=1 Tax=[Phormidium] sp. ETS-05 TaxID=222819 RepID=UPI0018EF31CD|nr:XRE family transcriptional regulator [[Phormidium] sp. ETS-05]
MNRETIKASTGNVFADLGLDNPEELLVKAEIAQKINHLIIKKNLNEPRLAIILGIANYQISDLIKGNINSFSLEMLGKFLTDLGDYVEKETGSLALRQESR